MKKRYLPVNYEPGEMPVYAGPSVLRDQTSVLVIDAREIQSKEPSISAKLRSSFYQRMGERVEAGREITSRLLEILRTADKPQTADELADAMGLTKSPIYRRLRDHPDVTKSSNDDGKAVYWHSERANARQG
jgi:hypothetical protein